MEHGSAPRASRRPNPTRARPALKPNASPNTCTWEKSRSRSRSRAAYAPTGHGPLSPEPGMPAGRSGSADIMETLGPVPDDSPPGRSSGGRAGGPPRPLGDHLLEHRAERGVELAAGAPPQLCEGLRGRARDRVGALRRHRVVGVADGDDASAERD